MGLANRPNTQLTWEEKEISIQFILVFHSNVKTMPRLSYQTLLHQKSPLVAVEVRTSQTIHELARLSYIFHILSFIFSDRFSLIFSIEPKLNQKHIWTLIRKFKIKLHGGGIKAYSVRVLNWTLHDGYLNHCKRMESDLPIRMRFSPVL